MNTAIKIRRLESLVLVVLFSAAICAPLAKQLLVGEPDTSYLEGKQSQRMPKFAGGFKWVLKMFPVQFNNYFNDHFGFRSLLIDASDILKSRSLHSRRPAAAVGLDGWFFKIEKLTDSSTPLTEAALENWKRYLERRQKWLASRGIKYLFVVPPDKETIYPEFVPEKNRPPQGNMPIDQIIAYLKKTNSTVNVLSLRDAVLAGKAKEHDRIYYTLDDHWNNVGSFYGYQTIIQRLAEWYPMMKPKSRDDYHLTFATDEIPGTDAPNSPSLEPLTSSLTQKTQFTLPGFLNDWAVSKPFTTTLNQPAGAPSVVMLRDSFTYALAPYLSENFPRITYLWPAIQPSLYDLKMEKILRDFVLQEKPALFIEERVQRFLSTPPDETIVFGGGE